LTAPEEAEESIISRWNLQSHWMEEPKGTSR